MMTVCRAAFLLFIASLLLGCPKSISLEKAAASEEIASHFGEMHYTRVFFVERGTRLRESEVENQVGTSTQLNSDGSRRTYKWATTGDSGGNLLAIHIGSDDSKSDRLVPLMSQDEFRRRWAACKLDRKCQDNLVNEAIADCHEFEDDPAECRTHCWWEKQDCPP